MLRKSRGFTFTVIVTLGLGIGLNSAIFSMVDGLLLREPAVNNPDRIAMVAVSNQAKGWDRLPASPLEFKSWREQNQVFEDMSASRYADGILTGQGEPENVVTARVTANYFSLRTFASEQDNVTQKFQAVISYDLWQRKFGADASILGKAVALNGQNYAVIGVMPPQFKFVFFPCDIWIPGSFEAEALLPQARQSRTLSVFALLKKGVSLKTAQTQIAAIFLRLPSASPSGERLGVNLVPIRDIAVNKNTHTAVLLLMWIVGFVLLIACTNIAGMFLARYAGRQTEFVVRAALEPAAGVSFGNSWLNVSCSLLEVGVSRCSHRSGP